MKQYTNDMKQLEYVCMGLRNINVMQVDSGLKQWEPVMMQ